MLIKCAACLEEYDDSDTWCPVCSYSTNTSMKYQTGELKTTNDINKCPMCGLFGHKHTKDCIYNDNKEPKQCSPLLQQAGGDHYKNYLIQPVEYCMVNKLNACQSNIIKYATRYKDKGGVEDLMKIKHYVDLILQLEYGITNPKEVEY